MRLLVEGWRGINHSYAMVNQYQLLELLKRPDVTLFHRDLPFHEARWNVTDNAAGFTPEDAARIAAIPPPDGPVDATLRIGYPHRAYPGEGRTLCFATCEFDRIFPDALYRGPDGAPDPATIFVTPSNHSRRGLINSGLAADKAHVVPHGVDPAIFHPVTAQERAAMRARLGLEDGDFVLLNVSAMTMNKGVDTLVLAFGKLHHLRPRARLLLKDQSGLYTVRADELLGRIRAGVGPQLDPALAAIRTFTDNFTLAEMRLLYGAADAYASPYRGEGFNLPPLEAAACGLPVIVTAGGATDDYAQSHFALKIPAQMQRQGDTIFLEPDQNSLARAMLALMEGTAPAIDPGKAIAWIGQNFTWKNAVDRLLDVIRAG